MKKIISILLVLVMCFSSIGALAAPTIDDILYVTYTDYEATGEVSFTLDKPLEILDVLSKMLSEQYAENDELKFSDIVDLRMLAESIFDTTQTINMKCDFSKDYKKINIYMSQSSNMPININKSLKISTDSKGEMWIKLDMSDIQNPVYKIIVSAPASDRYMVMDYAKLYNDVEAEEAFNVLSSVFNEETFKKITDISIKTLKENADISYKGGYLTVKMNDAQAKNWIIDVLYQALNMAQIPDMEFTEEQVIQLKMMLSGVQIFGKNGIEMKFKTNSKGIISEEETKISIDVNLYDILALAGAGEVEGITKDNSNIAFTINTKDTYSKVNKGEKVKFPTLTDENTIEIFDYSMPDTGYDEGDYVYPYDYVYVYTTEPIIENATAYVPLREFMASLTEEDAYISWDNGTTTITSATKYFKEIIIVEGSNIVIKDGAEIILDEPVRVINGKTALSYEFIEKVFDGDFYNISSWHNSGGWEYAIDVANPDYKE